MFFASVRESAREGERDRAQHPIARMCIRLSLESDDRGRALVSCPVRTRPVTRFRPRAQVAGAEAVISHLVTRVFGVPCAHAPACAPDPPSASVAPRAAAEELGHTFLPCVLANLHRAPSLVWRDGGAGARAAEEAASSAARALWARDASAFIAPRSAFGGAAALEFAARAAGLGGAR